MKHRSRGPSGRRPLPVRQPGNPELNPSCASRNRIESRKHSISDLGNLETRSRQGHRSLPAAIGHRIGVCFNEVDGIRFGSNRFDLAGLRRAAHRITSKRLATRRKSVSCAATRASRQGSFIGFATRSALPRSSSSTWIRRREGPRGNAGPPDRGCHRNHRYCKTKPSPGTGPI